MADSYNNSENFRLLTEDNLKKIVFTLLKILIVLIVFIYLLLFLLYLIGWQRIVKLLSPPLKEPERALENGKKLLEKSQTIVVVGAHPDDVEWYTSGTLALLTEQNKTVIVVIATDTKQIADVRRKEQLEAAKILNYDKVVFLGYEDRKLSEAPFEELKERVKHIILKSSADTLITFDPEFPSYIYRHPDHMRAGEAALKAAKELGVSEIYLFHTSKPDTAVNITKVIEKKLDAFEVHKSQHQNNRWFRYLFPFTYFSSEPIKGQLRRQAQTFGENAGLEYAEFFRKR